MLAAVRVLQGIGFSAFFVANYSYVIDLTPPARRGWALGIYGVAGLVATAVAPLIGEGMVRRMGFGRSSSWPRPWRWWRPGTSGACRADDRVDRCPWRGRSGSAAGWTSSAIAT